MNTSHLGDKVQMKERPMIIPTRSSFPNMDEWLRTRLDPSVNEYKDVPASVHVWKCRTCGACGWISAANYFTNDQREQMNAFTRAVFKHFMHDSELKKYSGKSVECANPQVEILDGFE